MPNVFVPQFTFCVAIKSAHFTIAVGPGGRALRRESVVGGEIRFLEIGDS